MPKYVQSKSSASKRKAQNKGVKHGTLRTGKSGRGLRKYDATTGRWNLVAVTGRTKGVMGAKSSQVKTSRSNQGPAADFVVRNVSPASSSGSARTSTGRATTRKRDYPSGLKFNFGKPDRRKTPTTRRRDFG